MRTKTLLLTAALAAVGVSSSMAQVYSVNVVGYINQSLPTGFRMIANQLDNGSGNKVANLIPNPPDGTYVFKFNPANGGYIQIDFADGAWEGDDVNMVLAPGEGVFISSPAAHNVTFVGEVRTGLSSIPIPTGFSIKSSVVPQSAPISVMGFVGTEGDYIYRFNPSNGGYFQDDFADGAWEGDSGGVAPTPNIAESFFVYHPGAAKTWDRTFNVN